MVKHHTGWAALGLGLVALAIGGLGVLKSSEQPAEAEALDPTSVVAAEPHPPVVTPASDEDVNQLIEALKDDPLIEKALWLQDLMNGKVALTEDTLGLFLQTSQYSPRPIDEHYWALQVPYRSAHATVRVAVDGDTASVRLDLRKIGPLANETERLRTLLEDDAHGGRGLFRVSENDILSLVDQVPTAGLTTVELDNIAAALVEQADRLASAWR